ncbi:MAG: apolipoprotein N-acyltransferase [Treponema sp.]|nr:apolipoprotein N-acyltransferase [Treponema sp.]
MVYKSNIKTVSLVGGIYGALSYALLGYWLFSFSSPGYFAIVAGYFFIYSILFLILKLVESLFKKNFWFVWWLIISSYEFLKTLGFAGFNYGVTGYSLWKETHIIQICDLIGVFGFTAFVIFPSFCIFAFIQKVLKKRDLIRSIETDDELFDSNTHIKSITETERKINFCSIVFPIIASIVWSIFFIFVLIYGFTSKKDTSSYPNVKILAVQTNDNPWKNGVNTYAENLVNVTKLTDSALEINTDVDIVVWPETAIVPSIVYQYESRIDERRYKIISYLLDYINEKSAVFVIGNGHTVVSKNDTKKNDYNSALVFIPGKNVIPPNPEIYSKMHLVPFSETFPYEKEFPAFYKYLIERGNHMWTPGSEYTVFKAGGLTFSTPICYEDTFEENSRLMYRNGARCFINLSNDAWCHNLACQNQHLSMAVFRSVENRVPSVRSTASGQTCIISLNGEILEEAEPFTSTYVIADVPVIPDDRAPTLYCRIGDGVGFFFVFLTLGFLLTKIIIVIIKKIRN